MFVNKVRKLDVLRLLPVRIEVVTAILVQVQGDPMFSSLIGVVRITNESERVGFDDFG